MSVVQKIAEIEAEMARTQKNKATAKHLGLLKAKLAKLRTELMGAATGAGGGGGEGFDVTKAGDTRVGLVGFPSVGKSTLLSKLTGTHSEAAAYEFTTLTCIPGTINYKGAKIQLLDLPGIIQGAKDGKGRGRQIIGTARTCNTVLIVLDAQKPMTHKRLIEKELEGFHIRLNQTKPNVTFRRKMKGGISFTHTLKETPKHLDLETVTAILREYRINSADIVLREDITAEQLVDVIQDNCVYMPCIYVLNKNDGISIQELDLLDQVPHYVPKSAKDEWNFDELLETVWKYCKMIRIYTKPRGTIPDYSAPVILHDLAPTVGSFCDRLHKGIRGSFKYAWVWGSSVKHQPQKCGLSHVLKDEDVVQIVKKTG